MTERCRQLIKITNNLWIGNSDDEKNATHRDIFGRVTKNTFDSIILVARDMVAKNDWEDGVEYMQIGLNDGPGNFLAIYHSAVLALAALLKRKENKVLVCCHDGGRSLAIVIMYMYLMNECPSWDECIERLKEKEKDKELPIIHESHKKAFFMMDWGMMKRVLDGEV